MKKYLLVGGGLLVAFVLYSAGKQPVEVKEEAQRTHSEVATILFDGSREVAEHYDRLQGMLAMIKEPVYLPFDLVQTDYSVETVNEHQKMTIFYQGEEQTLSMQITTYNPAVGNPDYKRVETEGPTAWLLEKKGQVGVIMEVEGSYYKVEHPTYEKEQLFAILSSLEESELREMASLDGLKFPTHFPGEVLSVGELHYTTEGNSLFTVTYLFKEEYTVAYTYYPTGFEEKDTVWEEVLVEGDMVIAYAEEMNQLYIKKEEAVHLFTSYGRELSLEEFLVLTK